MSKKFDIHEWQAKQRKQRLDENMYLDANEFERENLEFDIKRYIGQTFASWMSPSNPPFSQEYAKSPYIDKLTKGIVDYIINRYKTRNESPSEGNAFGYAMQNAKKGEKVKVGDQEFTKKEHHNDEDFPGKNLSAWDLLDKLKSGDKKLYDRVEDFMKSMKEMSMTSGGASFNAGNSMAHLGKKKKTK